MSVKWRGRAGAGRERAFQNAFVREIEQTIASCERLRVELGKIEGALMSRPGLLSIRFPPEALAETALRLDPSQPERERATAALVALGGGALEARARAALGELLGRAGSREEANFLGVAAVLISEGPFTGVNPFWVLVLRLSAVDAIAATYVRGRLAEQGGAAALRAEAAEGRLRPGFDRFLEHDPRARGLRAISNDETTEWFAGGQLAIGALELNDIALPLPAMLHLAIEIDRLTRRHALLADIAPAPLTEAETRAAVERALAKDAERAAAAFRADLLRRWDEAAPPDRPGRGATPGAAARAVTRFERIFGVLLLLEYPSPLRQHVLLNVYAGALGRAVARAADWERPQIQRILRSPLERESYHLYAADLLGRGQRARAAELARAALALFPGDENLAATLAAAEGS